MAKMTEAEQIQEVRAVVEGWLRIAIEYRAEEAAKPDDEVMVSQIQAANRYTAFANDILVALGDFIDDDSAPAAARPADLDRDGEGRA